MPAEFDRFAEELKGKKGVDNPFALARHIVKKRKRKGKKK